MALSKKHLAAMREGRRQRAVQDANERQARQDEYRAWVREDARLYRALLDARESDAGDLDEHHCAWLINARLMPSIEDL